MSAMRSLIAAAIALAPACIGGSTTTTTVVPDDPVGDTVDEGHARGDAMVLTTQGELSGNDYAVVIGKTASILAAINDGEVNQASFAIGIIGDGDVFGFANRLIADHNAANDDLDRVVATYGIGYLPSGTADSLAAESSAGVGELRGTPPEDFDFRFVEMQTINHAEAQDVLGELAYQVGPGAMGDYIARSRDMVDEHLTEATDLLDTYY